MHGNRSQTVCPDAVARLRDTLPLATLERVEDAGHTLPLSHPGLILDRVRQIAQVHLSR
jgi:pimeloyl-ACP methyl ester carboxylesterase